jgi:hypothetical protein
LFTALQKAHNTNETDPQILDILIDGIDHWFQGIPFNRGRYLRRYHPLIQSQSALGWRQVFNGHLACEWQIQ